MPSSLFLVQFLLAVFLLAIYAIFQKIPNNDIKYYSFSAAISTVVGMVISIFHFGFFLFDTGIKYSTFFSYFVNDHPLFGFFYFLFLSIIIESARSFSIIKYTAYQKSTIHLLQHSLGWTLAEGFWLTSLIIWDTQYSIEGSIYVFNVILIAIFFAWNYLMGYLACRSVESSKFVMLASFFRTIFLLLLTGLLARNYYTSSILLNMGSITLFQIFLTLLLVYEKSKKKEISIE